MPLAAREHADLGVRVQSRAPEPEPFLKQAAGGLALAPGVDEAEARAQVPPHEEIAPQGLSLAEATVLMHGFDAALPRRRTV
mgnify:CR=1 FL=1